MASRCSPRLPTLMASKPLIFVSTNNQTRHPSIANSLAKNYHVKQLKYTEVKTQRLKICRWRNIPIELQTQTGGAYWVNLFFLYLFYNQIACKHILAYTFKNQPIRVSNTHSEMRRNWTYPVKVLLKQGFLYIGCSAKLAVQNYPFPSMWATIVKRLAHGASYIHMGTVWQSH